MELALAIAGICVIGVGVILSLLGAFLAWKEYQARKRLGGAEGFVNALTEFVKAVADKSPSIFLISFGALFIFLGGVIAGVGGLIG
jgi:hypothetical protein